MARTRKLTSKKTLALLLSGKHPETGKYAGKHVMVVDDTIVPLKEGLKAREEFSRLKKKYGQAPTLTFVPRPDISYIL